MAVTAGGTPYVESSDLVANYPAVSLALAEHVDDVSAILQVVRATDTTNRTTSSATFVDASISVTITPQRNTSSILLLFVGQAFDSSVNDIMATQITNAANTAINGAQEVFWGNDTGNNYGSHVMIAYNSPATVAATTYKARFRVARGTAATIEGSRFTTQMYAIEVSA